MIGELAEKVMNGAKADEIELIVPWHPELPVEWWDAEADKSLLIGIFKHGNAIADRPTLTIDHFV